MNKLTQFTIRTISTLILLYYVWTNSHWSVALWVTFSWITIELVVVWQSMVRGILETHLEMIKDLQKESLIIKGCGNVLDDHYHKLNEQGNMIEFIMENTVGMDFEKAKNARPSINYISLKTQFDRRKQ